MRKGKEGLFVISIAQGCSSNRMVKAPLNILEIPWAEFRNQRQDQKMMGEQTIVKHTKKYTKESDCQAIFPYRTKLEPIM